MKLYDNEHLGLEGYIRIFSEDKKTTLFEEKNVIVLGVKYLFARMFANLDEPMWGVWGLALGAGDSTWQANSQPDALATQEVIISPILRKPISRIQFVDKNYDPVSGASNIVEFQTIVNATTDNITSDVREMGLIGGGTHIKDTMGNVTKTTDPTTAGFWKSSLMNSDSMVLLNYKTLPPLKFPPGVNFMISWTLTF